MYDKAKVFCRALAKIIFMMNWDIANTVAKLPRNVLQSVH